MKISRKKKSKNGSVPTTILSIAFGFVLGMITKQSFERLDCKQEVPDKGDAQLKNSGWHQIDVFYGKPSNEQSNEWNGQVKQDQVVWNLLSQKRNGFFVDLAANDAEYLSNTYALETRHGWNGICIEPNHKYWHKLVYRKCKVIGAVVGHENMKEISFKFEPQTWKNVMNDTAAIGGIVGSSFDNKNVRGDEVVVSRYTVTLGDIFARNNVPPVIDYLSLDVEGAESYIMSSFPFEQYMINIMTIERPKPDLKALLKQHGYVYLQNLGTFGEQVWTHKSILSDLDLKSAGVDASALDISSA